MGSRPIRAILGLPRRSGSRSISKVKDVGNPTHSTATSDLNLDSDSTHTHLSNTYSLHSRSFKEPTRTPNTEQHYAFVEMAIILELDDTIAPYSTDVYLSPNPSIAYYIRESQLQPRDKRARVAKLEMGIGSEELVARLMQAVAKDDFREPVVDGEGRVEEGVLKVELVQVRVVWEMMGMLSGFWTEVIGESDAEIGRALEMMRVRGWGDHFELVFGVADDDEEEEEEEEEEDGEEEEEEDNTTCRIVFWNRGSFTLD